MKEAGRSAETIKGNVLWIMEMVREKPRRRSVSELFDWRCLAGCKDTIAINQNGSGEEELFLACRDKEPETRRRKRSGTWP